MQRTKHAHSAAIPNLFDLVFTEFLFGLAGQQAFNLFARQSLFQPHDKPTDAVAPYRSRCPFNRTDFLVWLFGRCKRGANVCGGGARNPWRYVQWGKVSIAFINDAS